MMRRPTAEKMRDALRAAMGLFLGSMVVLVHACAPQEKPMVDVEEEATEERRPGAPAIQDLPPAPSYPQGSLGHLVAVSAGDARLDGRWQARAGLCDEIGVMEVYATVRDTGTVILVLLGDQAVRTYPVLSADSLAPDTAFARIGVQAYWEREAIGLRGVDGTFELTRFDEYVSGRFAAVLKEVQSNIFTHYVGVFDQIPLDSFGDEYCRLVTKALAPDADTTTADTVIDGELN